MDKKKLIILIIPIVALSVMVVVAVSMHSTLPWKNSLTYTSAEKLTYGWTASKPDKTSYSVSFLDPMFTVGIGLPSTSEVSYSLLLNYNTTSKGSTLKLTIAQTISEILDGLKCTINQDGALGWSIKVTL